MLLVDEWTKSSLLVMAGWEPVVFGGVDEETVGNERSPKMWAGNMTRIRRSFRAGTVGQSEGVVFCGQTDRKGTDCRPRTGGGNPGFFRHPFADWRFENQV